MIVKVLMLLVCLQFANVDSCNVRPRKTCEAGWTKFDRVIVEWCFMYYIYPNMNKTTAENICAGLGAEISSIDNMEMKNLFSTVMSSYLESVAWVGIALKPECNCGADSCLYVPGCGSGGYYWTDKYTYPNDLLDYVSGVNETSTGSNVVPFDSGLLISGEFHAVWSTDAIEGGVFCGKEAT